MSPSQVLQFPWRCTKPLFQVGDCIWRFQPGTHDVLYRIAKAEGHVLGDDDDLDAAFMLAVMLWVDRIIRHHCLPGGFFGNGVFKTSGVGVAPTIPCGTFPALQAFS